MSPKTILYTIPVASTSFAAEAYYHDRHPAAIRYSYFRDEMECRSGIRFKRVYAVRMRSESCSKAWHIENSYDTLVEIEDSPWTQELQSDTLDIQQSRGEKWEMHHYMIYLDSSGCFEILAESWEVLPEERGSWEST
jgi:hypothetical protein